MSEYSQTYGSFIRTGDYPLEANYIFPSEEELINFYTNTEETTHLHQGLFKIVGTGDTQSLYWVIKEADETLVFKKLLEGVDRSNILNQLDNLQNKLQEEITNRENAISEVWGDEKDNVLSGLNSIKKISDALNIEIKKLNKLHDEFNALVGTADRDIIAYLQTLPYQSLTQIAEALDNFLNKKNSDTDTIDTLEELKEFLTGITDSDTLVNLLNSLYSKIQGTPIPSEQYRTLRGIEDKLIALETKEDSSHSNLQTELNTTQIGVGLNQDGSYSPDATSNYLQNSTSITNALHILDNLIYTAVQEYNLETPNTGNVILNAEKTSGGYKLTGNIKLNPDVNNQLDDTNGLYHKVNIDYSYGTLTLKVNDKVVDQFNIGTKNLVSDAFYDSTSENIVIDFILDDGTTDTVRIPVGSLIREWDVDNTHPEKVVVLSREESYGDGADKLSADVRISTKSDNLLQKDSNTLYVSKNEVLADVQESLQTLKDELETTINTAVTLEKNRAEANESALNTLIAGEIDRATAEEASIRASLTAIQATYAQINATLDNLIERVVALETKTSW